MITRKSLQSKSFWEEWLKCEYDDNHALANVPLLTYLEEARLDKAYNIIVALSYLLEANPGIGLLSIRQVYREFLKHGIRI